MTTGTELSPMMTQYQALRHALPEDALLMFRLGDFYELYFEDAKTAAKILNVTLTRRGSVLMCGVPYHASESYIRQLVNAGKLVAIAEQIGEPRQDQLMERKIVRIENPPEA